MMSMDKSDARVAQHLVANTRDNHIPSRQHPRDNHHNLFSNVHATASSKVQTLICLLSHRALQCLFESSEESPEEVGLGVIPGKVCKFTDKNVSIPHMVSWREMPSQSESQC
jgi:imidazoleglycerol phosphate synthase glutamine amidotransferase subunit HisH